MDKTDFEQICTALVTSGRQIVEASYDRECFGSWAVVVRSVPLHRIAWEGKDGWRCIERETNKMFGGKSVWKTLWVARERKDQSAENAVDILTQLIGTVSA
jgi:hypothetical protein